MQQVGIQRKWRLVYATFLFLLLCTSNQTSIAQSISGTLTSLTDQIYNLSYAKDTCPDKWCWQHIYDSLLPIVVREKVQSDIARSGYYYPSRFVKLKESPTYHYLLASKYRISLFSFNTGCVKEPWFETFDSLNYVSILDKYGPGFFIQKKKTADSLDRLGLGLQMPFIINQRHTLRLIQNKCHLLDSLFKVNPDDKFHLFVLKFQSGKLVNISACQNNFAGIWEDFNQNGYAFSLEKMLNEQHWHLPTFKGVPIDITLLFNLDTGVWNIRSLPCQMSN